MVEEIPKLRLLNEKQKEQAKDLFKYYKFIYLCNKCGNLYGSDNHEKFIICPTCENKLKKEKKK
jgi:rubrerythrin